MGFFYERKRQKKTFRFLSAFFWKKESFLIDLRSSSALA